MTALSFLLLPVFVGIIAYIATLYTPNGPLEPYDWKDRTPLREMHGPLAPNELLMNAELLNVNSTIGPEAFIRGKGDVVYTGLADGRAVSLDENGNLLSEIFFSGGFVSQECKDRNSLNGLDCNPALLDRCKSASQQNYRGLSQELESTCGRVLGLEYQEQSETLYIIDAYFGLFSIDTVSGQATHLFDSRTVIPRPPVGIGIPVDADVSKPMRFLNDLTILPNGMIYFTDSSWKHSRFFNRLEIMDAAPRGRVLQFDPNTSTVTTILCGLHFPNGITTTPDKSSLLIVESMRFRILKMQLSAVFSPEMGLYLGDCSEEKLPSFVSVWADSLPGFGDNLDEIVPPSEENGEKTGVRYYLGLGTKSAAPFSLLYHMFFLSPRIRAAVVAIITPKVIDKFIPRYGLFIELNESGEITASYHDPSGRVPFISAVFRHPKTGIVLLGSSQNPFVGRVRLP